MSRIVSLAPLLVAGLLGTGCHTWGTVEGYKWSLKAPEKVMYGPGNKLVFSVETTTPEGKKVEGISYVWNVEWVNLHGSNHNGKSSAEQSITVKGGIGTAMLRIYAYDKDQKLAEVARHPFAVEDVVAAPPPAH